MLPPRRLTHKDAKEAARLYGLTYDEVRAREREHNEEWRRRNVRIPEALYNIERNGIPARAEVQPEATPYVPPTPVYTDGVGALTREHLEHCIKLNNERHKDWRPDGT